MDNIDINGKLHDLHSFTGIVISTSERSQTVVTGSDSRVSDNGHIRTKHSSQTTTFVDIVVRNNLGKEHHLHLVNWNVSCAVGNELRFFWIDLMGNWGVSHQHSKSYLAIKNYTTDEVDYLDDFIGKLVYPGYISSLWASIFLLSFLLMFLFFGILVISSKFFEISGFYYIVMYIVAIFFHIKYWHMAQSNIGRVKSALYARM